MTNSICSSCDRSLVVLGRMLSFHGEDICEECFKKRVDGGDFSQIESMTVVEQLKGHWPPTEEELQEVARINPGYATLIRQMLENQRLTIHPPYNPTPMEDERWEKELDEWLPDLQMMSRPGIVQNGPLKTFIRRVAAESRYEGARGCAKIVKEVSQSGSLDLNAYHRAAQSFADSLKPKV